MTDEAASSVWRVPAVAPTHIDMGAAPLVSGRTASVNFIGKRRPFFGILLSGLILLVPTLGLYRFWLVTRKRHFYWGHTDIDGDALEYTGTPAQLLVGFLMAVLIFLPIYIALLYVTVRLPDLSSAAYMVLFALFWFFMGYAGYRSRRFRLSRTLWRGIRFQQSGNAWVYAFKRFVWTIATIVTLGLAYPFMAKSLWAYRVRNTWYGDQRFSFTGRVRTIAGPFYGAYVLVAAVLAFPVWQFIQLDAGGGDPDAFLATVFWLSLLVAIVGYLAWIFVTTRIDSRFFSSIGIGEAGLKVRISAVAIVLQHLTYVVLLGIGAAVFGFVGLMVVGGMTTGLETIGGAGTTEDLARFMHMGSSTFIVLIAFYLGFLGLWNLLSEMVLAVGYWKVVARGAQITNIDALDTVRAAGTESPLAGEGLADALNVGAY